MYAGVAIQRAAAVAEKQDPDMAVHKAMQKVGAVKEVSGAVGAGQQVLQCT